MRKTTEQWIACLMLFGFDYNRNIRIDLKDSSKRIMCVNGIPTDHVDFSSMEFFFSHLDFCLFSVIAVFIFNIYPTCKPIVTGDENLESTAQEGSSDNGPIDNMLHEPSLPIS